MARFCLLLFSVLLVACGQSGDLYLPGSSDAPTRVSEIDVSERVGDDTDSATDDAAADDDKDKDDDAEQGNDAR